MSLSGISGNKDILTELKTNTDASVMFVGDSISNNGGTNFRTLWHGALFAWHPDQWGGAWFNVQSSNLGVRVVPNLSTPGITEDGTAFEPGNDEAGFDASRVDFRGEYSNIARGGVTEDAGTAQAYQFQYDTNLFETTAASRPTQFVEFADGLQVFEDSDGVRRIADGTTPLVLGPMLFGVDSADSVSSVEMRALDADDADGAGAGSVGSNIDSYASYPITTDSGPWSFNLTWTNGENSYTSASVAEADEDNSNKKYTLLLRDTAADGTKELFMFGNFLGREEGLKISFAGYGGWEIDTHGVDYPNGDEFEIAGITSTWGYTDEHITARMEAEGTTHLFINLGNNDLDTTNLPASQAMADINQLLTRFSTLRPSLKFIFTTIYEKDGESASVKANREQFNAALKLFCDSTKLNCVCVDLASFCKDSFADQSAFSTAWLEDGTHPNATGAYAMQEYIWSRVTSSADANFEYGAGVTDRNYTFEAAFEKLSSAEAIRQAKVAGIDASRTPISVTTNSLYKRLLSAIRRFK